MNVPRADSAVADDTPADRPPHGRIAAPGRPLPPPPARETWRLYRSDWQAFARWCATAGLAALPAAPATVAGFLAASARTVSAGTLARRAAAIAHQHRQYGMVAPTEHPAVTGLLHQARRAASPRRPPSPRPAQLAHLAARCPRDRAGLRDRALLLMAAAAPGRRGVGHAALLGLTVEQLHFTPDGVALDLAIEDQVEPLRAADPLALPTLPLDDGAGPTRRLVIPFGGRPGLCPVQALRDWLHTSNTLFGPVFRKVDRWGNVEHRGLGLDALRRIVAHRAARRPRRTRTVPP
ncbi:MAG TPA: hypothetical protein VKI44_00800 [Acetobacteraceae bacterium]|nr:hypothetical protein [Acetobacteraceae bacterium]